MANSIDDADGTGFQPPIPLFLPIVGTIELALRTFAKAPFTLIGMSLIPLVPAIVIDAFALVTPKNVHPLLALVSFVVQYVVQFTVMAAMVIVTRNIVDGRAKAVSASLQQAMHRLLPLIAMLFLQFFAIVLGFLLFIVPGIIVAIMLFVALPACVLEDLGPVASLQRSAQLSKGNRLRLFAIALLILIVLAVFGLLLGGAIATSSKIVIGLVVVLSAVVGIALAGVALTLSTIVFLQLRRLHVPGSSTAPQA